MTTAAADTTIKVSWDDWQAMAAGQLDGMTAFMTGKLKVEGDMSNAMQLQGVLAKLRGIDCSPAKAGAQAALPRRSFVRAGPRPSPGNGAKMQKIYPDAAAALDGLLSDGMTIAAGGFGLCGIPGAADRRDRRVGGQGSDHRLEQCRDRQ